jgi:hypothetical protein
MQAAERDAPHIAPCSGLGCDETLIAVCRDAFD